MTRRKWYQLGSLPCSGNPNGTTPQNQSGIAHFAEYDPRNTGGSSSGRMQANAGGQKFWSKSLQDRGISGVLGGGPAPSAPETPSMKERIANAKGNSPATLVSDRIEELRENARRANFRGRKDIDNALQADAERAKSVQRAKSIGKPVNAQQAARELEQEKAVLLRKARLYKESVSLGKLQAQLAAPMPKAIEQAAIEVNNDKGLGQVAVKGKKKFFMRKQMILLKRYPGKAAMIAGGAAIAAGGAKLVYDQLNKPMTRSNFSMSQVRSAYERDRHNSDAMAYFAGLTDEQWKQAAQANNKQLGGVRNAAGNLGDEIGKKAVAAKNKVLVMVKGENGKNFMQARWKNVKDIAGKAGEMAGRANAGVNRAWAGAGTGGKIAMGAGALAGGYLVGRGIRQAAGWNEPESLAKQNAVLGKMGLPPNKGSFLGN